MNHALIVREAAAERGALDPRPEPPLMLLTPTRLYRVVEGDEEVWIDPRTGKAVEE
jgi:hypothetical protein